MLKTRFFENSGPHVLELVWASIAFAGGIAKYFNEMYKNKSPFKFTEMLAKAFVSGFIGWTAAHLALSWGLNFDATAAMTGIMAWMGSEAADFLFKSIIKKWFPPMT